MMHAVRIAAAGMAALFVALALVPARPAVASDPYLIYVFAELTGSNAFVGSEEAKSLTVGKPGGLPVVAPTVRAAGRLSKTGGSVRKCGRSRGWVSRPATATTAAASADGIVGRLVGA